MATHRFSFSQWVEVWRLDNNGFKVEREEEITNWFNQHNDVSISIDKSITSNGDTASISIYNHQILEAMYRQKYGFLKRFFEHDYEVDIMQWYEKGHADIDDYHVQCIFTGDLDDLSIKEESSNTDQALELKCTSGKRVSTRTLINKKYSSGISYRAVVEDIFRLLPNYELTVLDDPLNKLNKPLKRARTYHGKAIDALNDIARDLEMTWGFDANPWLLAHRRSDSTDPQPQTISAPKHCYFVDKVSVFDVLGVNGKGAHVVNGSTGRTGRIGYTKSQFTFSHLYDPVLNIGMSVNASDFGTMNEATEFIGSINRMSINNNMMSLECQYIDPSTGLAVIEEDKKNTGALVL